MSCGEELAFPRTEINKKNGRVLFFPRVREQRQQAVYEILSSAKWNPELKKIIDFGCGKLEFFNILKYVNNVDTVLCIDINEDSLKLHGQKAKPSFEDNISPRETPLEAKVYKGSIAEFDHCLLNTDAVICIEVIEHLYPPEIDHLPFTIFGFTQPKLVILSTPNVEFNILFPNPKRLRNRDHKFEWTRQQFQDWANNIISRYTNYRVEFRDVGPSPKNYEHLGPATQMAVFYKINNAGTSSVDTYAKENCSNYELIYDFVYPVKNDRRVRMDLW